MKVRMLSGGLATGTLIELVRDCTKFDVAVAWAGKNAVVDAMLANHRKLGKAVIGTHMYQTDPAVLRKFMPYSGARCLPPSGQLFHPKIYLFEMRQQVAAMVGSHNLTGGAFGGTNIEVSVLIEGDRDDPAFKDLKSFVATNWDVAEAINEDDFLVDYEAQYRVNKAKREGLDKFNRRHKSRAASLPSILDLEWDQYVERVKNDRHHSLHGRLAILERAATLFRDRTTFSAMSLKERKAVAGTYGSKEPRLDDLDWLWFGTMTGLGAFTRLVNRSPAKLSKALDQIPADGDVSKEEFNAFARRFRNAFQGLAHKGGVATATRLLVIKRPDIFVGVDSANRQGVCNAFGSAPTTLTLQNYWDRIVVPMRKSPWWSHARPRGPLQRRIWANRAALLDCIYYAPSEKPKTKSRHALRSGALGSGNANFRPAQTERTEFN